MKEKDITPTVIAPWYGYQELKEKLCKAEETLDAISYMERRKEFDFEGLNRWRNTGNEKKVAKYINNIDTRNRAINRLHQRFINQLKTITNEK